MAAVTLDRNVPTNNTSESNANKRRRVIMPEYAPWLRIYQPDSDCYVELVSGDDASSRGDNYETIPAGTQRWKYIGRGECAVSCAGTSAVVQLTATNVGRI